MHTYALILALVFAPHVPKDPSALLKPGLQAKNEPNGAAISGVGDAAVFSSTDKIRSKTMALVKGFILQVNYEALDGFAQKDHVIALLKAAAARL